MYCRKCGAQLENDVKFCKECGTSTNDTINVVQNTTVINQNHSKKSGCLRPSLLIALIFVLGLAALPFMAGASGHRSSTSTSSSTSQPEISEDEYKAQCNSLDYSEIVRRTDGMKGEYLTVTGKITQVKNDNSYIMSLSGNEDYIVFKYTGTERYLEDDVVTIWGVSKGLKPYTSILKGEVMLPEIGAKYVQITE